MKYFVIFSLLVQLAFSAPVDTQEPHFKAIYVSGEMTIESENLKQFNVDQGHTPGLEILYEKNGQASYLIVSDGLLKRNDVSFVVERKPGFKCKSSLFRGEVKSCNGDLELRELRADEKAIAAQTTRVLANISGDELKFKLTHDQGKQTVQVDFNSIRYIKTENNVYPNGGPDDQVLIDVWPSSSIDFSDEFGTMSLIGKNIIQGERFVVEGSADDCKESDLKRLLQTCAGGLKLRELTEKDQLDRIEEDRTEKDLPQKNAPQGPQAHQGEKADQLELLLKQLLSQLMN